MPLTLEQLAVRICPKDGDLGTVIERVKNWARSRVLRPLGGGPGQGRVRLFERIDVVDAALLNVLSEESRIAVLALSHNLEIARSITRDAAHAWAEGNRGPRWIVINLKTGAVFEQTAKPGDYAAPFMLPREAVAMPAFTCVNLQVLLGQIGWSREDEAVWESDWMTAMKAEQLSRNTAQNEARKKPRQKREAAKGKPATTLRRQK
jgi:hypothetical protein